MSERPYEQLKMPVRSVVVYVFFVIIAIMAPPIVSIMDLPNVANTQGKSNEPFELFGLFAGVAILAITFLESKRTRSFNFKAILPTVLFLLVAFHYLIYISDHSIRSGDYQFYEKASEIVSQGGNPYETWGYLYPPLMAQVMVATDHWIKYAAGGIFDDVDIHLVFYFYQCLQYLLLLAAYRLSLGFTYRLGVNRLHASMLVAAIFLCSNPLLRTLRFNQVNLLILDSMLLAMLVADSRPWLSGLSIAIGTHIKLYPAILGYPWLLTRKFRPILWSVAGFLAIVAVQSVMPGGLTLWRHFASFMMKFHGYQMPRDNSLLCVASSITKIGPLIGIGENICIVIMRTLYLMLTLAVLIWYILRSRNREKSYRHALEGCEDSEDCTKRAFISRECGHFADVMAFLLLLSPIVWEHHYILAVPFVIWAVVVYGIKRPWLIGIAALLIFAVPTYDFWPLSYNRLAGLLMLLYATPPAVSTKPFWL